MALGVTLPHWVPKFTHCQSLWVLRSDEPDLFLFLLFWFPQLGPNYGVNRLLHAHVQAGCRYCQSCFHPSIVIQDIVVDVHLVPTSRNYFSQQCLAKAILKEDILLPFVRCRLVLLVASGSEGSTTNRSVGSADRLPANIFNSLTDPY